jgi:hypothetical protein
MRKSSVATIVLCFIIVPLICLQTLDGPQTFMIQNLFNSQWGYFIDQGIQNIQRIFGILIILTIIGSLSLYLCNAILLVINKKVSPVLIYVATFLLFIKPLLWYLLFYLPTFDPDSTITFYLKEGLRIVYEDYVSNIQHDGDFNFSKMILTSAIHLIAIAISLLTLKNRKQKIAVY